ncbi:MAG: hypothetical protein ACREUF_04550, partial [Solimonas sp.]
ATPTKLGLAAVNDGHLVANLRKGHSITLKTADKVRAYMARHAKEYRFACDPPPDQTLSEHKSPRVSARGRTWINPGEWIASSAR